MHDLNYFVEKATYHQRRAQQHLNQGQLFAAAFHNAHFVEMMNCFFMKPRKSGFQMTLQKIQRKRAKHALDTKIVSL